MTRELYDAHPAFGLSRSARSGTRPRELATLPLWWLRLTREQRHEREREYFATLLALLSERDGASFQAPARAGADEEPTRLTPQAARALAAQEPESLAVWDAHGPLAEVVGGWPGTSIWLSPQEAEAARRQLPATDVRVPGGTARALLLRASHVLLYVACIAPGVIVESCSWRARRDISSRWRSSSSRYCSRSL